MRKKEIAAEIEKVFDKVYAEAKCSLDFENPLQLLIATQLAAQCTDARVNLVTPALFERYKTAKDFAEADVTELESYIHSTGFFRNKARNIIGCCIKLLTDFGGVVPDNMDELLTLPGVGRKTANIILGDVYNKPAVVIDTHAKRIAYRIGLTDNTDPTKIEFDLMKILNPSTSAQFCHCLVYHGRAVCKAISPQCEICPIAQLCKKRIKKSN